MNDASVPHAPRTATPGQIFVAHADLTQLSADAVTLTTSTHQRWTGQMGGAFQQAFALKELWKKAKESGAKLSKVGDALWLPLETETKPYGLVITVCTGEWPSADMTLEKMRSLPVKAAIKGAFAALREGGVKHRLLIGLPLMRFGQGGDSHDPLGSARHQIAAAHTALDELAQTEDWQAGADVVFAAYTHDHYQVVLQARRLENLCPPILTQLPANFGTLLHALRNEECVMFVGAGLSAGTGFKGYDALIQHMAEALGEDLTASDQNAYLDLAQWFRDERPNNMGDLIAETFGSHNTTFRPALPHYLLMSMMVRYILTTNYDGLLERTLDALRRYPVRVITDAQIAQTGRKNGTFVVKMHGDADYCKGKKDAQDGIVVSRDDYDQFFARKPMMASLLEGLLLNRTFCFVGYSLRDPNFRQIHAKIAHTLREAKQPAFTFVFETLSEPAKKQWNKQQVFPVSIAGDTSAEKSFHFACLLDHIAERVTGDSHLFLARKPSTHDEKIENSLEQRLREVGTQLEIESERKLNKEHAMRLARTLVFLTEQGWRPERSSLPTLWERLADAQSSPNEKHACLIRALSHAERADVIDRLRKRLEERDMTASH
jgi:NAD-dependent SIR2 family protein deacetylase